MKSSSIQKIFGNQKKSKIKLEQNDKLVLTIGSKNTIGIIKVLNIGQKVAQIRLKSPICFPLNEKVVISKELNSIWHVIGKGNIIDGNPISIKS